MRRVRLKSRILIVSCVTLIATALIISTFVTVRALDYRYENYELSIRNLIYTTASALQTRTEASPAELKSSISLLSQSTQINSASLVDGRRRVIAHAGEIFTPPIRPDEFPQEGSDLLHFGSFSVYIEKLNLPEGSEAGQDLWLIAHAERQSLQREQGRVLRTAVVIFLLTSLVSVLVANYLTRHVITFMRSFEKALLDVQAGREEVDLRAFEQEDLDDLQERLSSLASQMHKYRTDIREEIEQTTQDLRQTLETIEIQNVELDIARKNAIKANNAKSEFLANMSHEIRTPLNGIIGFAKMLMRSPLNTHQADTLRAIHKSSEVLLMIINDILDFSKIEAGRIELEHEELDLYELIEDIVVMLAPSAHAKGLELNYLFYNDVPTRIIGDSLRLKQVITNLINNAIKFTEHGEIILRVMLDDSLQLEQDNLKISISDTGIGLSEYEKSSIFKAFSQADASTARQYGGTGLGLSICRGLVVEMDGDIDFESHLGKGSTFWFTLPLSDDDINILEDDVEPLDRSRCLVFEPHDTSRTTFGHVLTKLNLRHQLCATRVEFEAVLGSEYQADTAILCLSEQDLDTPEISDLFTQLKRKSISILLYIPTLKDYDHPLLAEADTYTLKPVTQSGLWHALESLSDATRDPHPDTKAQAELARFQSDTPLLAVDDNEMNLTLIRALVNEMGLDIELAQSGKEALEKCQETFYPLIFMDIQMPDMDGVTCLKTLKHFSLYRDTGRVIALTAFALPSERAEFINEGFVDLITKPINEKHLQDALRQYVPNIIELAPEDSPSSAKPMNGSTQHDANTADSNMLRPNDPANIPTELIDYDWAECVHLSNGNEQVARELSEKLFESLPASKQEILAAHQSKQLDDLLGAVHKLHGVSLICGTPRIRHWAHQTELKLKTEGQITAAEPCLTKLLNALDALMACAPSNTNSFEAG